MEDTVLNWIKFAVGSFFGFVSALSFILGVRLRA